MRLDPPAYVVVGGGRWAGIMREVLAKQGRTVRNVTDVRRGPQESKEQYRERISTMLAGGQIAWICLPPCTEVPLLIEAAIESDLHAVVEKPWMLDEIATEPLARLAEERGVLAGVHFQYCFLDEVKTLALGGTEWVRFGGTFTLGRADRLGLPPIHNLGSHLLAIREYIAPGSEVSEIRCGYEMADERRVVVQSTSGLKRSIELATNEPLVQRFLAAFESGIAVSQFPFGLRFGAKVFTAAEKTLQSR